MFERIVAKNFLSWKELDFSVPKGITLVTGFNYDDGTPEGSGKSAVLNALCYGLFGRLPKESKVDDVIQEGAKTCSVTVHLTNGLSILRSRKPNKLCLFKATDAADIPIQGKDAKETQNMIEAQIGMGFETFCQSVYFAQNYPNKFITANEDEKAKILSEVTEIGVFDRARKRAHELRNEVEAKLLQVKTNLDSTTREIASFQSELESIRDVEKRLEQDRQNKIRNIERQIEDASKIHQSLEGRLFEAQKDLNLSKAKLPERESKIEELQGEYAILKNKISSESERLQTIESLKASIAKEKLKIEKLRTEIKAHENPKNKTCPTCGTVLEKIDKAIFANKIEELEQEVVERTQEVSTMTKTLALNLEVEGADELKVRVEEIARQISATKALIERTHVSENLVTKLTAQEESHKKEVKKIFRDLEEIGASKLQDFSDKIAEIKKKISKKQEESTELSSDLEGLMQLGKAYTELKDGFREVKSYVFQGVLQELNRKANKYLTELFEVPVKLSFSNTSEEGDISKIFCSVTIEGVERPLGLYSGGQFRRIQLAVDFALSDVIAARSDRPINLIILDESFKDLSSTSMEKVLNLLTSMKKSAILIEHNEVFKNVVSNTFEVEYRDGTSRRVE